eukprot:6175211-Pleurochrysis_carterae.AAC.2
MYAQCLPRTPLFGVYLGLAARSRTRAATVRERARGAGAKRTYGAALGRGHSAGSGGHRERVFKSLRSGARALRKYACDANAIWETVHVSVRLQMKGARDD